MRYVPHRQTKREVIGLSNNGLLAGDGKGKKIFTTISTVIDDLSREANSVFDYAKGKESKTNAISQNRLRNPFWDNAGLPGYMHYMTTAIPQQKQAGLIDPNAFKFVLLLGVAGFLIYKLLPTSKPEQELTKQQKKNQ